MAAGGVEFGDDRPREIALTLGRFDEVVGEFQGDDVGDVLELAERVDFVFFEPTKAEAVFVAQHVGLLGSRAAGGAAMASTRVLRARASLKL